MPIRLINPDKPIKWAHPQDRDVGGHPLPNATVFNIVALTEGKARELRSQFITGADTKAVDINAFKMEMFLLCVKSIDNVTMPGDSQPRSLNAPEDIRLFLDWLPVELVGPIYDAIQNLTDLDAGTIKNSVASPALPHS